MEIIMTRKTVYPLLLRKEGGETAVKAREREESENTNSRGQMVRNNIWRVVVDSVTDDVIRSMMNAIKVLIMATLLIP